jgi:dTDP-4-dehydrorhamnose 3,5-epimerase
MSKVLGNVGGGFVKKTSISGLLVIERPTFPDERGFFHEVFRLNELEEALGGVFRPVQINHSRSLPRVIRAIHTEGWNKLVYPVTGKLFVAIADVRVDSETFGKVETFTFDSDDAKSTHRALFLPAGIGNSICVVGDKPVDYIYAVDEYWENSKARGIAWNDPDLNINWPVKDPIISERDMHNPTLRELFPDKFR